MSQRSLKEDSFTHRLARLITRVLRSGRTSPTTLEATFGVWDVFSMNSALSCRLSELLTWEASTRRWRGASIPPFLQITHRILLRWLRLSCRSTPPNDLTARKYSLWHRLKITCLRHLSTRWINWLRRPRERSPVPYLSWTPSKCPAIWL